MKHQAFNPFLPCWEYVPDGEPHIFGERVYLYGSHDAFDGISFCQNDYVCWSAPVDDLSSWQYHGVIYRKMQDPMNDGTHCMYAPDVARGKDGRWYLYYTLDFLSVVSVAVAAKPEGPYSYYGVVRDMDGHVLGQNEYDVFMYDPAVLVDEDGSVHLYSGVAAENSPLALKLKGNKRRMDGSYHYLLANDMLTVLSHPARVAPGWRLACGTPYAEHSFFEASSIRRVGDKYYFVYSTNNSHELAYAVCGKPDGAFEYGGVLVSTGDIGLDGRVNDEEAVNYLGTTHGSIICIREQWYVFYHRHSNDNQLSRQACAEKITIQPDGHIRQAEVTSCGLNDGDLEARGTYPAYIACNLSGASGPVHYKPYRAAPTNLPYLTQDKPDGDQTARQYIHNMTDGSWCTFKYFCMKDVKRLALSVRGSASGKMEVCLHQNSPAIGAVQISPSEEWRKTASNVTMPNGHQALFLKFIGTGSLDLLEIAFE